MLGYRTANYLLHDPNRPALLTHGRQFRFMYYFQHLKLSLKKKQNILCRGLGSFTGFLVRLIVRLVQVNPQLFSSREKQQMRELIDTMLAYNLSYRQDRTAEGQYTYVLEP